MAFPDLTAALRIPGRVVLTDTPDGAEALALAAALDQGIGPLLFAARDSVHAARVAAMVAFIAPTARLLTLPAWDCLPYDRGSPAAATAADRLLTLFQLTADAPDVDILLVTARALAQRTPPREAVRGATLTVRLSQLGARAAVFGFLEGAGYQRVATVREPGEYAVRGGLADVYPAGAELPLRLDFLDEVLESLSPFDPMSQRREARTLPALTLTPITEVPLDATAVARFRQGYRALFGVPSGDESLYAGISAGRRYPGMEHWLPLFYPALETVFDWLPGAPVVSSYGVEALDAAFAAEAAYNTGEC